MPNVPGSVVVAVPVVKPELVPYAKPRMVVEAPPSFVMLPFRVRVEVETRVGGDVVMEATVLGMTGLDALEALPVPMMLVAVTVKVYGMPLTRPVMM